MPRQSRSIGVFAFFACRQHEDRSLEVTRVSRRHPTAAVIGYDEHAHTVPKSGELRFELRIVQRAVVELPRCHFARLGVIASHARAPAVTAEREHEQIARLAERGRWKEVDFCGLPQNVIRAAYVDAVFWAEETRKLIK